jgi:3-dehydroquinate dehydratase-2
MKLLVINGPNINFLGIREKSIYGQQSYESLCVNIKEKATLLNCDVDIFQANGEGEIIDRIQKAFSDGTSGVIINPGAYTHYSYAIADAIASINLPFIEVHISNVHKREEFRHKSVTASVCDGQIVGLGLDGYTIAMEYLYKKIL